MAQVTITEAVRKKIKDNIAYAATHRLREGQDVSGALQELERYAVTISPQIRVRYVEHQMSDRVMAHLSIHGNPNSQLDDQIVEQLATEYGLGPRTAWQQELKDHPPAPSSHVFKTLSESAA